MGSAARAYARVDPDDVLWEAQPKQAAFLACSDEEVLFGGAAGGGKASPVHPLRYRHRIMKDGRPFNVDDVDMTNLVPESRVLTPKGWVQLGDIKPGMQVANPDGTTSTVRGVFYPGEQPIYRVRMADGASVDVGEDHLWAYSLAGARQRGKVPALDLSVLPDSPERWNAEVSQRCRIADTRELKALVEREAERAARGKRPNHVQLPMLRAVQFTQAPGRWPTLSPYTLGALIGDGSLGAGTVRLSAGDPEVLERVARELPGDVSLGKAAERRNPTTGAVCVAQGYIGIRPYLARDGLDGKRSWEKSIPKRLLFAPLEQRWALAQGLFDTDGHMDKRGHIEFVSVSERLALDVRHLVRSLGFRASIRQKRPTYRAADGEKKKGRLAYRLTIQGVQTAELFHIPRKRERAKRFNGNDVMLSHRVVSIEPMGVQTTMCIQVTHMNHLYVTDDFIVTHNSDALVVDALGFPSNATDVSTYRAVLFRTTYPQLEELIDRSKELYSDLVPGARFNDAKSTWFFPSGAQVKFRHMDGSQDRFKYQGHHYQFIGWDELTHQASDVAYRYLLSRLRNAEDSLPRYCRATTNPGGVGHHWVRRRFRIGDAGEAQRFGLWLKDKSAAGGRRLWRRRFIPSRLADNRYLAGTGYEAQFDMLSAMERRALLDGRWDVIEITGAIYEKQLERMHADGRVIRLPFERTLPCVTFWDLGNRDATALWIAQEVDLALRFVHYHEASRKTIVWWSRYVRAWAEKRSARYERHFMPHDVEQAALSVSNLSRRKQFENSDVRPIRTVERVKSLAEGIAATREFMGSIYIDPAGCERGLDALGNYRWGWDEDQEVFSRTPVENWAIHGADALRTAAEGYRPAKRLKRRLRSGARFASPSLV